MTEIPEKLKQYLGSYNAQIYDGYCGETIGWGYEIIKRCGEVIWSKLGKYGDFHCIYPTWFLVTKWLSKEEAIKKYGKVTNINLGPRGGFHGITFGKTKFCSRKLNPKK